MHYKYPGLRDSEAPEIQWNDMREIQHSKEYSWNFSNFPTAHEIFNQDSFVRLPGHIKLQQFFYRDWAVALEYLDTQLGDYMWIF